MRKKETKKVCEGRNAEQAVDREGEPDAGVLNHIDAQNNMKAFYGARVARPDLLRAIGHLTRYLTKWTDVCDERMQAAMDYIYETKDFVNVGWVGDPVEDIRLHLYTDSDFVGCQKSNKSTTGVFLVLDGPNTYF